MLATVAVMAVLAAAPKKAPASAAELRTQANVAARAGEYEQAVVLLRKAIALEPEEASAHKLLAAALANSGEMDQSTVEYHRFLDLAPNDPDAPKVAAMLRSYEKSKSGAGEAERSPAPVHHASAVAEPGPSASGTELRQAGEEAMRQGDYDKATKTLRRAVTVAPRDAQAHKLLGSVLANGGEMDAAAVEYRLFVKLAPNDPETPKVKKMLHIYEQSKGQ
jgi:Flp pilus assembly protein TadD